MKALHSTLNLNFSSKEIQLLQLSKKMLLTHLWIFNAFQEENRKLKQYYNKEFDTLQSLKVREIYNLKERYARLNHIISEINYFSTNKINITINNPEWRQDENPELIIKVDDKEVGIFPYISPSQQQILDAKAAEEERIRLKLLADDFRERALMTMMNGVLEVRWEDELKKDVPLPKCMVSFQQAHCILRCSCHHFYVHLSHVTMVYVGMTSLVCFFFVQLMVKLCCRHITKYRLLHCICLFL